MPLASGTRLGSYEITGAIGAGGMGEVYRARDSKLGRDVAVKVLPAEFASDADRMARFQREAKLLASLNHQNIATIHGLEDSNGTHALVMELAQGVTLADRIKSGPIPVEEALPIARQICDALEYAHERGIIHRDLKPANIKVAADDSVKILDFGLAKALEADGASPDIVNSPTLTQMATQAGMLLGTAAYMSPEQAKAKPVDRRADIWAFGCVLYEMLTAKMAFRGETTSETLAAVLKSEPDWSLLPPATPGRVRVLLQRCLQKDPKQRLRDIGDARISLDEVLAGAPEAAPLLNAAGYPAGKPWRMWLGWGVAGVFVLATAALAALYSHKPPAPAAGITRFDVTLPEGAVPRGGLALSPDGTKLAFVAAGVREQARIWVRSIDTLDARPLDGTEGANSTPVWSSDSRFIAFAIPGKLMKVESTGGPAITLCDAPSFIGGSWNRNDEIIFGSASGLQEVSAAGGTASALTSGGLSGVPSFLPDGRHFIYLSTGGLPTPGRPSEVGLFVGSLESKPGEAGWKRLLPGVLPAAYAPSASGATGYLLYVRGTTASPGATGTLMAQPFDPQRLEVIGEAVPIAENVPNTSFSASSTNALAFATGRQATGGLGVRGIVVGQLAWFDRAGKVLGTFGDPGTYRALALSPDARRVAFERTDPQNSGVTNVWLYEFARGVTTRFTFDSGFDSHPTWSPDGSRIVYGSQRSTSTLFDLYWKPSNLAGNDELLLKTESHKVPSSWSPDGRYLLFFNPVPPSKVWILPVAAGTEHKPVPIEQSDFSEAMGRFSPDGRWIAYSSDESGSSEVYVRPFDASQIAGSSRAENAPASGKWMVSKGGGNIPLWRKDGKELFYLSTDGTAMTIDVNTSGVFQAGVPKPLFRVPPGVLFWDVSPDGKRFIMAQPSAESARAASKFTVVLNWQSALKK
jgi:Tol biopolymer transport system component